MCAEVANCKVLSARTAQQDIGTVDIHASAAVFRKFGSEKGSCVLVCHSEKVEWLMGVMDRTGSIRGGCCLQGSGGECREGCVFTRPVDIGFDTITVDHLATRGVVAGGGQLDASASFDAK